MNPADTLTQRPIFGNNDPKVLLERFGSPLYVYNEAIFRQRCREMRHLIDYPHFTANYSIKANSNLTLLKIAREEGLYADAMSPGEIFALEQAGFTPDQIFFVPNNVSAHELDYARERQICISLDSLDQLEMAGQQSPSQGNAKRI